MRAFSAAYALASRTPLSALAYSFQALKSSGAGAWPSQVLNRSLASSFTPAPLAAGLGLYALSLVCMLFCSATFNMMVATWKKSTWELQLADHLGILLLIAGTYTPFMLHACSPRVLAFVWLVGAVSFAAKASKSPLDVVQLHVPCFLAMGWACTMTWTAVSQTITPWAIRRLVIGGCLYTGGLVPWACNFVEFHNAIWHVCVLAASAVFYSVVYHELALPPAACAGLL